MTEIISKTGDLIQKDERRTVRELAGNVGIRYGVCREILTGNLNMCNIATEFVPQLLQMTRSSGA
jgi:hypothetical protein